MILPKADSDIERLLNHKIGWLATSANSIPHLVPIWFILLKKKIYICTGRNSKKVRNIIVNPKISFSLEDGSKPLILIGEANIMESEYPVEVIDAYKKKYDWTILNDSTYDCLIEISAKKWLMNK